MTTVDFVPLDTKSIPIGFKDLQWGSVHSHSQRPTYCTASRRHRLLTWTRIVRDKAGFFLQPQFASRWKTTVWPRSISASYPSCASPRYQDDLCSAANLRFVTGNGTIDVSGFTRQANRRHLAHWHRCLRPRVLFWRGHLCRCTRCHAIRHATCH
ncbi:unnamed protein product [Chondrus crispus]|uniref:Uncharacterized protein n=1 Tax=Chondrus crispus TaxID=2769 RepID=R7QEQ6_CHOCR|nr:unnamed protein product [Chondrus crispus]CDF36972.1 unnamed protein product [Chondrus crispus]|eukprot:XP_005716791.1 unnamed protein product [Chondrus crispus]